MATFCELHMMTFVPQTASWVLCVAGLILFLFTANQSGKAFTANQSGKRVRREVDPLKLAGLSSKNRIAILVMIKNRRLPPNPAVRALAFERVAYDVTIGARVLRWQPFIVLGIVLAFCGLYPTPIASTVALLCQCIVVLFGAGQYWVDRRRLLNSRMLAREGWIPPAAAGMAEE
jgi:hypothetical protein